MVATFNTLSASKSVSVGSLEKFFIDQSKLEFFYQKEGKPSLVILQHSVYTIDDPSGVAVA